MNNQRIFVFDNVTTTRSELRVQTTRICLEYTSPYDPGSKLLMINFDSKVPDAEGGDSQELRQVLDSRAFEKAPTLRRLLTYLWEHRTDDVGEYAIATEALGRKADFEPRVDATVRVLVSRLRQRLKEFYEAEGSNLPTRIAIPLGSHQLQVVEGERQSSIELGEAGTLGLELTLIRSGNRFVDRAVNLGRSRHAGRTVLLIQFAVILILVCSNGWMLWERSRAAEEAERSSRVRLPIFWERFLQNGKSTRIVLPTPIFFGWSNGFLARDVNVNEYSKMKDSATLSKLSKDLGTPALAQQYFAASDSLALLRLDRFLDPAGNRITISTTADSPADTLDRENLIATGTPRTLAPFQSILDRLSFRVDPDLEQVTDRRSTGNAARIFGTVHESPVRFTTPGIIASLPGGPAGTHVLLLVTTYYTSALVSYLTSESGMNELQNAQHAHGDCRYFEAVIVSEINGTTELRSKLIEFRPYQAKP